MIENVDIGIGVILVESIGIKLVEKRLVVPLTITSMMTSVIFFMV